MARGNCRKTKACAPEITVNVPDVDLSQLADVLSCKIIAIDVCFEDCTTGYNLVKVNCETNEVTPLGSYNLDGTLSTLAVVPCPEYKILEDNKCIE